MVKQRNPNIVVIGGGTGMPVLLRGLKNYPINLTAVVTVADDGGSTGKIREKINIPAPGDIRNVIAALSNVDDELYELFQYRIAGNNGLSGHALGNLLLVATNEITGDFNRAVEKVAKLFNVQANILPIVNEPVTLHAEMKDGTVVTGESNIPLNNQKINRVFLTPNAIKANEAAIEALLHADMIVISPGSLYTSILPNLIIEDVMEAMAATKAKVVYVCNIMTQPGETNDYSAADHIKAIYQHVDKLTIDSIVVNSEKINATLLETYEKEKAHPVVIDKEELEKMNISIIEAAIVDDSKSMIRHDNGKVAELIYELSKTMK